MKKCNYQSAWLVPLVKHNMFHQDDSSLSTETGVTALRSDVAVTGVGAAAAGSGVAAMEK